MKENIFKNGSKEKVPFDSNVIDKAIDTSLYIEGKKAEILLSTYDKTTKLINEVKNDTIQVEKHKKQVKDSKSKLDFLNVITDYIIIFLDNERMNTIGGEEEHKKIMNEACENLQRDLEEIQNMYSLLIKEINGKATKKQYKELYNVEYLNRLKEDERRFERDIKRLSMIGTVIYPDYWRIEGMEKIFDTFKNIMTNTYQVDLSEFEPLNITFEVKQKVLDSQTEDDEDTDETEDDENETLDVFNTIKDTTSVKQESEKIEEDNKKSDIKFDVLQQDKNSDEDDDEEDNEDDEFHWDEDDEDSELRFSNSKKNDKEDDDDYEKEIELPDDSIGDKKNDIEDDERDKEIDEILGIFDTDYSEEKEVQDEESHILQIEEDDDELDDSVFEKEDDEQNKKERNRAKKKSLFGRRK